MSTSIKRLYQNGTEFVPITLQEAVVVNTENIEGLKQLGITTLDKVLRTTYGILGNNVGEISKLNTTVETINQILSDKQDKLKPGKGITIAADGTISTSLDFTLYKIVSNLPLASADCDNSIYLVLSESGIGGNAFKEFICVNRGSKEFPSYSWEEIGTVQTSVDLSGYVDKNTFNSEISTINSKLDATITAEDITTSSGNSIQVTYSIPGDLYDNLI